MANVHSGVCQPTTFLSNEVFSTTSPSVVVWVDLISSSFKQSVFLMFHHMDYLSFGFLPQLSSVSFSSGGRGYVVLLAFLHVVALAYRWVLHWIHTTFSLTHALEKRVLCLSLKSLPCGSHLSETPLFFIISIWYVESSRLHLTMSTSTLPYTLVV